MTPVNANIPEAPMISPNGLIKRIVGEEFKTTVTLNPDYHYQVELYSNINHTLDFYKFDFIDHQYVYRAKLNQSGNYFWQIRYKREGTTTWKWIREAPRKKFTGHLQVDPDWLNNAIAYNIFVRFFSGVVADDKTIPLPGEGGTFDDVKAYLDVLQAMGINLLYFNPIHVIGELYRKYNPLDKLPPYLQPGSPYSIKDYKSIDPELTYDLDTKKYLLSNPQKEFKDLIDAAHARGMYIVMDMVFNHTAHDFVFQRIRPEWYLYKESITSLTDPYLYPTDLKKGKPWGDAKHTLAPYDHGIWLEDVAQLNWEYRLPGAPNSPPPNPSLNEMWQYLKSIPLYWLKEFGVDGFRCDMAYRIPPKFWQECISETRSVAQSIKTNLAHDAIFIAEAYTDDLSELQESGFSLVYSDFSNKLHNPAEISGYLKYLYNISDTYFPDGSKWFMFPEVHDFDRAPSKMLSNPADSKDLSYKVNASRWVLSATVPGIPLIFNGFEKVEWKPVNLFSYGAVDWEERTDLKKFIAKVNQIRHQRPEYQLSSSFEQLDTNQGYTDKSQLFAFIRRFNESTSVIIVNMDVHHQAGPAIVYLPSYFNGDYTLTDELTGKTYARHGCELTVILEPAQSHLFSVKF